MMEHLTDTFVCFVFQLRPVDAILFNKRYAAKKTFENPCEKSFMVFVLSLCLVLVWKRKSFREF